MVELTTSSIDYLHLPYLPFDLVEQILCRLPVNTLLRFRCVCKSLNSLIFDPKFAKKHLSMSITRRHIHFVSTLPSQPPKYMFTSCPLHDDFTTVPTNIPQYPWNNHHHTQHTIVGSCNGIICLARTYTNESFILLWNPSIRKVKELSPLCYPDSHITYGFGYDYVTDNYKVVAVLSYTVPNSSGDLVEKTEVKVNILGTNSWTNIQDFPSDSITSVLAGKFVSGTINWLASKCWHESPCFIVSLDLGKESYQKVLLPDCGEVDVSELYLSVLRNCLCMIYGHDIWIMKEYGNYESWTKLFRVPYMRRKSYNLTKGVYMFEDDRVLLEIYIKKDPYPKLTVYDSRSDTLEFIKFHNKSVYDPILGDGPEICIESLISPCF